MENLSDEFPSSGNSQELKEFSYEGINIKYIPTDFDIELEETKSARALIAQEIPQADLVIVEYFPEEVGKDPIFVGQVLRFQYTTVLAAQHGKPVLVVDPAYNSQFIIDFRGIPLGVTAIGALFATPALSELLSSGKIDLKPTRRNFLKGAGTAVAASLMGFTGASVSVGEYQLRNYPETKIPTEGGVRRTIVNRGIQKTKDYLDINVDQPLNALVVYPKWLELTLNQYTKNPSQLEESFGVLNQFSDIPRFRQYFDARLYTPGKTTTGQTMWKKTILKIT